MKLIVFGIAGLLVLPASAQEPRALEVEDVLALAAVSNPEISPEGSWVAYVVTKRDFEENINDSDVWVVRTEDGEPVQLTHHKGVDNSPRWAPDGTWLAFVSDRGEKTQVYGIRPDGGEAWPVTEWATDIESFRFSPDGARLAFVAKPDKTEDQEEHEKERGRPHV